MIKTPFGGNAIQTKNIQPKHSTLNLNQFFRKEASINGK